VIEPAAARLLLVLAVLAVLATVLLAVGPVTPSGFVKVSVDRTQPAGESQLDVGLTYSRSTGDSSAAQSARQPLLTDVKYHNVHIMGFGADNPEPLPGVYAWQSLDARMSQVRLSGATPVVTLCCAPTWMVDPGWKSGTDWSRLEAAPLPQRVDDFARLAGAVARRYPDVQYFQVWNELKGMWDDQSQNWDYVRYTTLYNKVYDAVKAVNPRARIGGPYLSIEGTGSSDSDWWSAKPITDRNRQVLKYWLAQKHGADFIALDRAVADHHDGTVYSNSEYFDFTKQFGTVAAQVKAMTNLPIWWSETYFLQSSDVALEAAGNASILYHALRSGASAALLWDPDVESNPAMGLASEMVTLRTVGQPGKGQTVRDVYSAFHRHFPPGTPLFPATASAGTVLVLASRTATLLINQAAESVHVSVDGDPRSIELPRYGVRVLVR
jgi:hypothetical protein